MNFTKEQKDAAFKAAEKNDIKGVLTAIFGEDQEKDNRPVIERVKTFEDAVKELGDNHPLVKIYDTITNEYSEHEMKPVVDYIKVCIIVAALNEGRVPQFVDGEKRWYPWFWLYTNKEMAEMDEAKRATCRVVGRSNSSANRTEELDEYAGKQFIEEYYQLNVGL